MDTQTADLFAATEERPDKRKYDNCAKKILANKYILANILKNLVDEVQNCTIEEIICCMDGEPEISQVPVPPVLRGDNLEDAPLGEGMILYDVRFSIVPAQNKKCRILFDVEAQKNYYPGYAIPTRGIFYGARMLSSQMETEFSPPHYGDLRKVYSIWVCFDPPKHVGNAISEYSIQKEDLIGHIPCKRDDYDKLRVIQICLMPNVSDGDHPVIRLLNTVFGGKSRQEIEEKLERDFQIPAHFGVGEEVSAMCNLSDLIEERGIEKGTLMTIRQALDNGMDETSVKKFLNATDEQIEKAKTLSFEA